MSTAPEELFARGRELATRIAEAVEHVRVIHPDVSERVAVAAAIEAVTEAAEDDESRRGTR